MARIGEAKKMREAQARILKVIRENFEKRLEKVRAEGKNVEAFLLTEVKALWADKVWLHFKHNEPLDLEDP